MSTSSDDTTNAVAARIYADLMNTPGITVSGDNTWTVAVKGDINLQHLAAAIIPTMEHHLKQAGAL